MPVPEWERMSLWVLFILPICCSKNLDLAGILVTLEASWHVVSLQQYSFDFKLSSFPGLTLCFCNHKCLNAKCISACLFWPLCKSLPCVWLLFLNVFRHLFFSPTNCWASGNFFLFLSIRTHKIAHSFPLHSFCVYLCIHPAFSPSYFPCVWVTVKVKAIIEPRDTEHISIRLL